MGKQLLNVLLMLVVASPLACNQQKGNEAKPGEAKTAKTGDKAAATKTADTKAVKVIAGGNPVPVGSSYTKGGKDAIVTIIEFSDFQCPFCSRVNPTIKQIQETYGNKVRISFKHNPLPFHKDAPLAAQAALAAGKQGKFWPMHDKLFANNKALKQVNLDAYAKELGLDMAAFAKDLNSPDVKKTLKEDMALAAKVGARGTPNFFINGKQLSGAQPFDRFKKVIDEEIKAAEALKKAGKSTDAIYTARATANFKPPAKRAAKQAQKDTSKVVYKIPATGAYPKGGKEPLVTILEFSEFQCPFCSRVNPTVAKIASEYGDKVQIIFKHNPLPFHKNAIPAAKAAIAAGMQGKFWPMHDILFKNQKALLPENLEGYAKELGLDLAKFKADMENPATKKIIDSDQALASQFGARGTPNFFINGRQLTGARPFDAFKTVIDEEIKKAEALIKGGTPRSAVYSKLTEKGLTKAAAPPKRERKQDNTVYKVSLRGDEFSKGSASALVTIVEFSEFQCPFCKRVGPTMAQIDKAYGDKVRVVFKHNPLPFHKNATPAAKAAIAAGKQGKFWPMHDKLFANQKALTTENLTSYATELGLDMAKFKTDMDSPETKKTIEQDQAQARQIGAGGTPNFFINGRKLVGAQPFANFKKLIDGEMAKAQAKVKSGISPDKIYAEMIKNGATKPAAKPNAPPKEDPNKVYAVKINPKDPIKGNKNAPITIVEFSDFQCPFCGRVNPTIKQIMDTYGDKVRVVFKQNPLSFHKQAPLAAEAALAAGAQGKFWPMHDILFKNQRKLARENLDQYAQELGLNMTQFKADLDKNTHKTQVNADVALARSLGATGTPSFFINGRKLRGAQPFPKFKSVIDEELKKLGK